MSVKESHCDVLIIGAGPAGVMAGNALAQAGVNVRIVDKRPEGLEAGQADAIQPRTFEIMESYGIRDRIFKEGEHIVKATFYNPGPDGGIQKTSSARSVHAPSARWEFRICYHQGGVEKMFTDAMGERGVVVERSTVPTQIELLETAEDLQDPSAYAAKVTLERQDRTEDNTEIVHAKFILGSDGAHSWVRKTLGIEMEGDSTDSIWGVVDMEPDTDFPDVRTQAYVHSHAGTLFMIPREDDLVRFYIHQADDSDVIDPDTGRPDKGRTDPEKLLDEGRKMLKPYYMNAKNGRVAWWTVYVVGQRVAEKYSIHERAFIAGDACHTHSPKAGQGMNASMGDTHNLAWKVAYVLRGWSPMSLLKTYESERRKFAQDLISFDKNWSKLFITKPRTEDNKDGITHEQFLGTFKTVSTFTTGMAIRYGLSALVNNTQQAAASSLIVGERVPPQIFVRAANGHPVEIQDLLPADTRFKILVFAGELSKEEDRAKLRTLAEDLNKPENFLRRYGRGDVGKWAVFDVLAFSSGKQDEVTYLDFPAFFRPHYSNVLLDDTDMHGRVGSGGYAKYGIDERAGAIVVVRPDGYVSAVAPLDGVEFLNSYFASFLL